MYGLSFSEAFFTGEGDVYETEPSEYPTNCYQAILSLSKKERLGIARDVLKSPHPVLACQSEDFEFEVLEKIRETDLCDDLSSPITVYIDSEQYYSITVYEEGRCTNCNERMDKDCQGELRCPECDDPCPSCFDGGGPGAGDEDDEDLL